MTLQELFKTPDRWTQNAWARDTKGKVVYSVKAADGAVCWCLTAGITKCYPKEYDKIRTLVMEEIDKNPLDGKSWRSPIVWNDYPGRTYRQVFELVTKLDI